MRFSSASTAAGDRSPAPHRIVRERGRISNAGVARLSRLVAGWGRVKII